MHSNISRIANYLIAAIEATRDARSSCASANTLADCESLFRDLACRVQLRTIELRNIEEKRRVEANHLRERTLTTDRGHSFRVAAGPWNRTYCLLWCLVGVGVEGNLLAVYKVEDWAGHPRRFMHCLYGEPPQAVTEAVRQFFDAHSG